MMYGFGDTKAPLPATVEAVEVCVCKSFSLDFVWYCMVRPVCVCIVLSFIIGSARSTQHCTLDFMTNLVREAAHHQPNRHKLNEKDILFAVRNVRMCNNRGCCCS